MKKLIFFICLISKAQTDLPGPLGALPISPSASSSIFVWDPSVTFKSGFTTGVITQDNIWTLPTTDSTGCIKSNGSYLLYISACTSTAAGGSDTNIQYNCLGALCGSSGLIWDGSQLEITDSAGGSVGFIAATNNSSGSINYQFIERSGGSTIFSNTTYSGSTSIPVQGIQWNSTVGRGTYSAPSAIKTSDVLASYTFSGFNGSTIAVGADILVLPSSNWTPTNAETNMLFEVAAPSTSGTVSALRLTGLENFSYVPLVITGTIGNPGLSVINGYTESDGGFLSQANLWNAFQSNTDGALIRGVGIAGSLSANKGGYLDFAPITYPPNGSAVCYDAYGNVVSQPIPLTGLSSFGTYDILLWNSTSPLQGWSAPFTLIGGQPIFKSGTACAAPIPVISGLPNGINLNAYIFARGGFATDGAEFNMIQVFNGGIVAQSITAAGLYPRGTVTNCCGTLSALGTYLGGYTSIGHSSGAPSIGTIATVNNPLTVGDGLNAGTIYWEDSSGCMNAYDGSNFLCMAQQTKAVTFSSIISTGAISAVGVINSTGASGGLEAQTSNFYNAIQAPMGGLFVGLGVTTNQALYPKGTTCSSLNIPSSTYGGFGYSGITSNYCYYNGSSWNTINLANVVAGVTSLTGTSNEIIVSASTGNITLSTPQGIGTGNSPNFFGLYINGSSSINSSNQFIGSAINVTGVVQSQITGIAIAFQTSNLNFEVNGNGVVSSQQINVGGNTSINSSNQFIGSGVATAGAISAVGVINSTGVLGGLVAQTSNFYNAIQAPVGGLFVGLGVTTNQALYPKGNTCSSLNIPASSYGGFGYSSGSNYCYYNGSSWNTINLSGVGAGVTSLSASTGISVSSPTGAITITNIGVTSLTGTSNEINVSASTGSITLSTPQGIGTGNSPNFLGLIINGNTSINSSNQFVGSAINVTGAVQSQITGTAIAFQTTNFNFEVNGNGVVSSQQINVGGNTMINGSGQFVGNGINIGSNGISAGGYNVNGGFIGQTYTVTISGGISISGVPSCTSGLIFHAGILVSCF